MKNVKKITKNLGLNRRKKNLKHKATNFPDGLNINITKSKNPQLKNKNPDGKTEKISKNIA